MGWGDELMAAGEVDRLAACTPQRVAIIDGRNGKHRWSELWAGHPNIARPGEPFDARIINSGGHRPYIASRTDRQWTWRAYRPQPARVFFTAAELEFGRQACGCVLIEPSLKTRDGNNKAWPGWRALVKARPDLPWLQIGPPEVAHIAHVRRIVTRSFRDALAIMAHCRAAVLPEGGLHHGAAAVGTPAVVIFGGFISPQVTGYATQHSLFAADDPNYPLGCGMRVACDHCRQAMDAIKPDNVIEKMGVILATDRRRIPA